MLARDPSLQAGQAQYTIWCDNHGYVEQRILSGSADESSSSAAGAGPVVYETSSVMTVEFEVAAVDHFADPPAHAVLAQLHQRSAGSDSSAGEDR